MSYKLLFIVAKAEPLAYRSSNSNIMKIRISIILLLTVFTTLLSCKKDGKNSGTIYGKWKLTHAYSDPSDGSGKYQKVTGPTKYLTFEQDGKLTGNALTDVYAFEIIDNKTMRISTHTYQMPMIYAYELTERQLILNPPCFEGCGYKFER